MSISRIFSFEKEEISEILKGYYCNDLSKLIILYFKKSNLTCEGDYRMIAFLNTYKNDYFTNKSLKELYNLYKDIKNIPLCIPCLLTPTRCYTDGNMPEIQIFPRKHNCEYKYCFGKHLIKSIRKELKMHKQYSWRPLRNSQEILMILFQILYHCINILSYIDDVDKCVVYSIVHNLTCNKSCHKFLEQNKVRIGLTHQGIVSKKMDIISIILKVLFEHPEESLYMGGF